VVVMMVLVVLLLLLVVVVAAMQGPCSPVNVLWPVARGMSCARVFLSDETLPLARPCCCPLPRSTAMCVVDLLRGRASTGPPWRALLAGGAALRCLPLRATATSGPLFRCAVVLQNEVSQPPIAHSFITSFAAASAVGVALACKEGCFLLLCAALLAVLWRAGKAPVLCAAVCLLLLHSALGVVARRVALKYAAPCCNCRWAASMPALRS